MCEYCGCQALASIDALTREHEQVLALISDVRPARLTGDVARQAGLACRIAAVLGPHTFVEEQGLFPALALDFPEQIALLEAGHRLIGAPLAEAVRAVGNGEFPADPAWPDRLTRALALLREHIFTEQDGVFPAALATLRSADWEAAGAARLAAAGITAASAGSAPGTGEVTALSAAEPPAGQIAYRVLAGRSRQALLNALITAGRPMDASEAARAVGLHRNTARAQLDILVCMGLLSRSAKKDGQRGRPRVLYMPAESADGVLAADQTRASDASYRELAQRARPARVRGGAVSAGSRR